MGLITKEVYVGLGVKNTKHYEDLGYNILKEKDKWGRLRTPRGTKILVKVKDLTKGSNSKVEVQCDNCFKIVSVRFVDYEFSVHKDNTYLCNSCATKIIATNKMVKTRLKNGKSFKQWCIENNRKNVLERWDYELNDCDPDVVNYKTGKKYYFKCPRGLHESELKRIGDFTKGCEGTINCKMCNSFAQWCIDNIDKHFLDKYWSDKNTFDPWVIEHSSSKKIFIKCQNKKYHEDYKMSCDSFINGQRCPYCNNKWGKVHPLDSLGALFPKVLEIWSDKNKKSPYEYAPKSNTKVWWRCEENIHKDYYRNIVSSNTYEFRCPECNYYKGERRISYYLMNNKITYTPQKIYNNLIGLKNGNLSYDFYLPDYNLLIEYQGNFHDGSGTEFTKINLKQQQEHDKRKKKYALDNNINLLEIWYWDYDNIEEILNSYLGDKI